MRRALPFLALLAAVSVPRSALAQDASDISAARELGKKGTVAAQAGRCPEAIDLLSRARALMPVPTVLTPLGECEIKVGRLVEGTEALQQSSHAELGANPPPVMVKARDHAKDLLASTLPRLAHLTIVVKAPAGAQPKVTDNGIVVSDVLVGVEHPVDPGKHGIEAAAQGYVTQTAFATLGEGQSQTVTLELPIDPNAHQPPPVQRQETQQSIPPQPPSGNDRGRKVQIIAGVTTLAVGGAVLAIGGVMGGLALAKQSSLDSVCDANKHCPGTSQSDIDSMTTFANTSTALFVVGGIAAAAGIVVVLTAPKARREAAPATAPALNAYLGPGRVGLSGSF